MSFKKEYFTQCLGSVFSYTCKLLTQTYAVFKEEKVLAPIIQEKEKQVLQYLDTMCESIEDKFELIFESMRQMSVDSMIQNLEKLIILWAKEYNKQVCFEASGFDAGLDMTLLEVYKHAHRLEISFDAG